MTQIEILQKRIAELEEDLRSKRASMPLAATLPELLDALPGASRDFITAQLEQQADMVTALKNYINKIEGRSGTAEAPTAYTGRASTAEAKARAEAEWANNTNNCRSAFKAADAFIALRTRQIRREG